MKRRNGDICGKFRRPLRKTKLISEGFYGGIFMYLKLLTTWLLVLLADFLIEFRFEYLWPAWLLIKSVYDSYKYEGLASSAFFVFIALTSDTICFLFIPVHWLFFFASTYVWMHYVWQSEKGVCLPTVSLWLIFVYIEASIRLKELKSLPFNLDLCRPFAAHCIGYPVISLGLGFKSHISSLLRLRKQKDVAKENTYYLQLIQQALPPEMLTTSGTQISNTVEQHTQLKAITNGSTSTVINGSANGTLNSVLSHNNVHKRVAHNSVEKTINNTNHHQSNSIVSKLNDINDSRRVNELKRENTKEQTATTDGYLFSSKIWSSKKYEDVVSDNNLRNTLKNEQNSLSSSTNSSSANHSSSTSTTSSPISPSSVSNEKHSNSTKTGVNSSNVKTDQTVNNKLVNSLLTSKETVNQASHQQSNGFINNSNRKQPKNILTNNFNVQRDEHVLRLEADIKRLKADLQCSRQTELDLRSQIDSHLSSEKNLKAEIHQIQRDNESLMQKLNNLVTARQQDKQQVAQLEKKLGEEKKNRMTAETQLVAERKSKKSAEEAIAAAAAAAAANFKNVENCTDTCKNKHKELENDVKQLMSDLKMKEEQLKHIERDAQSLRQYKESFGDCEILMSALTAMKDKNAQLENSLSAETRVKLDLFSALGEAKRQLDICIATISQRDKEIEKLKSNIAELMAVMPSTGSFSTSNLDNGFSSMLYGTNFLRSESPLDSSFGKSNLDPTASIFKPKGSDLQ